MVKKDRIVALIPVRGGSKGIPKKNIKIFAGKPLVYWTLLSAELCNLIDEIYVSTDDEEIKKTALSFGFSKVKVIDRSKKSATDTASTEIAILEFAKEHFFDILVLLQVTSPLTTYNDLYNALGVYLSGNYDTLLSVARQKRFIWEFNANKKNYLPTNYNYLKRPRRQDFKGFMVENGAIYIMRRDDFLKYKNRLYGKIGIYEMPEYTYNELDTETDWNIMEGLASTIKNFYLSYWLKNIKLLILDVDGVLTDGGVYYSEDKEILLKFNRQDGKGIQLLKDKGIKILVVSSENSPIIKKRCEKLKIENLFMGIDDKISLVVNYCKENKIDNKHVAVIGDDVQDLPLIEWAGFSACPSNAVLEVKNKVCYICSKGGGDGAVREVIDLILGIRHC